MSAVIRIKTMRYRSNPKFGTQSNVCSLVEVQQSGLASLPWTKAPKKFNNNHIMLPVGWHNRIPSVSIWNEYCNTKVQWYTTTIKKMSTYKCQVHNKLILNSDGVQIPFNLVISARPGNNFKPYLGHSISINSQFACLYYFDSQAGDEKDENIAEILSRRWGEV